MEFREMHFDEDLALAWQLQEEFNEEDAQVKPSFLDIPGSTPVKEKWDTENKENVAKTQSIVSPSWELIDPTPDIHAMFVQFNKRFFWQTLDAVVLKWSARMTSCAGVCSYDGKGTLCSIRLSLPLLKLRPRKDLVETLLHEMIHAFLFVTDNDTDRDGHGPKFHKHMYRINKEAGTNITVYHSFHAEVELYQQHWWRCDGPCQKERPFFGVVKRAMNRPPGPTDFWWARHQATCGGTFVKVREPLDFGDKSRTKGVKGSLFEVPGGSDIRKYFPKITGETPGDGNAEVTAGQGKNKYEVEKGVNGSTINSRPSGWVPSWHTPINRKSHTPTWVTPFSGKGHTLGGVEKVQQTSNIPTSFSANAFGGAEKVQQTLSFPKSINGKGHTLGGMEVHQTSIIPKYFNGKGHSLGGMEKVQRTSNTSFSGNTLGGAEKVCQTSNIPKSISGEGHTLGDEEKVQQTSSIPASFSGRGYTLGSVKEVQQTTPNSKRIHPPLLTKRKSSGVKNSDDSKRTKAVGNTALDQWVTRSGDAPSPTLATVQQVTCPSCNALVAERLINDHLDSCLMLDDVKCSIPGEDNKVNVEVPERSKLNCEAPNDESLNEVPEESKLKCESPQDDQLNVAVTAVLEENYIEILSSDSESEDPQEQDSATLVHCPMCNGEVVAEDLDRHLEVCVVPGDSGISSGSREGTSEPVFTCPCCGEAIMESAMNSHLDECLS